MICAEDAVRLGIQRPDFSTLYVRHHTVVLSFVQRRVHDRFVAEDLTAETFVKAWKAFLRYEERGAPFACWLLTIAHREVINYSRRRTPIAFMPHDARQLASTVELPEDRLVRRERAAWLHAHLRSLPVVQRQALWLRFGEERSFRDIAATLGRRENSTRVLLHRALKTLRRLMKESTAEWEMWRPTAYAE